MDWRAWFNRGKKKGARYMIVVCDMFDHEDYPVFVRETDSIHERIGYYRRSPMQRVMAVYDLTMDREKQLVEGRVFNYPKS
jgi:hypothetical protein